MGSKAWWKKVDTLSKRKEKYNPSFDEASVRELNHYFANLCHDEDYIRPVPMDITEHIPAPQLTLSQVYYALLKTKQTSTGPDNIPFWVWKENAAILAPAVPAIWKRSLSTQRWPGAWTQANVYPLPKVDIPVQPQDFRGICVTPVIARTFERVVYNTFGKEGVESYLNNNQFAYRTGGSCTNALLKKQHEFLQALDSNDNRVVRLFTMDFSKAFDRVKHNLLIEKLTQNPFKAIHCQLVRQLLVRQKTKSGLS